MSAVVVGGTASAHPTETAGPLAGTPAALSTSGDYATDVLGDPWDFSNDEDVPPTMLIGTEGSNGISRDPSGVLTVNAKGGSTVKLVRTWGMELPWGRDGLLKPVDAATYTRLSFSMNLDQQRNMGVEYWTESVGHNIVPFQVARPGWTTYDVDLTAAGLLGPSAWSGKIIAVNILAGGGFGGPDAFTLQLDWVRLRRANASIAPVSAPIVSVVTPSDEGGADYATVSGNPWDFAGPDDVASMGDIINASFDGTSLNGTTHHNNSFVELPLRTPFNPDRYHRATVRICEYGPFGFADAPGGGMVGRFAWFDEGGQIYSETQDIIVYPGCNRMTVDLATNPAGAVNDENTIYKAGWRGLRITALRFDPNEDPGDRTISLDDIRLADDAAFSSGTYPVSFSTSMGGTADIFVTTNAGAWDGTKVGTINVAPGINTFNWDGSGFQNGTYSVYVVVHSGNTVGSAYSTGPVRIERPVSNAPACYVPLNPARLLDTRDGTGGNISGLSSLALTELKVAGVGGVPANGGATAVVLNVTVDAPLTSGFIMAWPSGDAQPTVSNLNYVAGQTVPNLVTVKLGANGRVNLFNSEGLTQVIADVVGYYVPATAGCAGKFTAVSPARVLDTRNGIGRGGSTAPVGAGQSIDVNVTGVPGAPTGVITGVALNVTVDQPTSSGFLTVWPTNEARPLASSHDFVPGLTVANLVLAKVSPSGQVSIFNSGGNTHIVADVVGYFSSSGTGTFVPLSPQRIVDSRLGIGRGVTGPLGPGGSINIDVAGVGVGGVPRGATAAIVNVTA
ncbi:MAG: hypothetical protein ACXV3B_00425, partial [Ilumatobacteraceae bacterium]